MRFLSKSIVMQMIAVTCVPLVIVMLIGFSDGSKSSYEDAFANQQKIEICGNISENTTLIQNISIGDDVSCALFFLNWSNNQSTLKFNLISPSGRRASLNSEGIDHSYDDRVDYYSIITPEPGIWRAEIKATELKNYLESYCLLVSQYFVNAKQNDTEQYDAKFSGIYSDKATDRDRDGLIDTISIKIGVNVLFPGIYSLNGSLYDLNDAEIQANSLTYLNIGAQSAFLEFSGINSSGRKRIGNLTIFDTLGNAMDHVDYAYMTKAYNNIEKDIEIASFNGDFSDKAVDINGDGFYDFLNIEVGVDALAPGEYTLTATLCSLKGDEIVWSIDHGSLPKGYSKMQLDFDGKSIRNSGIDGPYAIKNIALSGSNWSLNDIRIKDYLTSAYNATQFADPANR
jgi:hypothetical protein